jgi:hypothetical protein
MELRRLRVVHYLNQFFARIGGEEKADVGPRVIEGYTKRFERARRGNCHYCVW